MCWLESSWLPVTNRKFLRSQLYRFIRADDIEVLVSISLVDIEHLELSSTYKEQLVLNPRGRIYTKLSSLYPIFRPPLLPRYYIIAGIVLVNTTGLVGIQT